MRWQTHPALIEASQPPAIKTKVGNHTAMDDRGVMRSHARIAASATDFGF
jgi:hypothetical protein